MKSDEKRKIKILHYVPGFKFGGIETLVLDWYRHLDREKYKFELLVMTDTSNNELIEEFIELGGEVHHVPTFKLKNLPLFVSKLKNLFQNNKFDVVHCHSPSTSVFVLVMAKKYNISKRILHSHTSGYNSLAKHTLIRDFFKKTSVFFATDYIAVSKPAAKWFFGKRLFNSGKVKVIHNSIDTEKFKFDPKARKELRKKYGLENLFVVGHIGRFSPVKNHKFILKVFQELLNLRTNSKLVLIGDGPLKKEIENQVSKLNLREKVLFLGYRNDVNKIMNMLDVLINPSFFEGYPVTIEEAQANNLPCILSDKITKEVKITDLVKWISLQKNAEYWANEVIKSCKNSKRNKLYQAIYPKEFDINSMINKLENIYG